MWKCLYCGEPVADNFEICWNCGTTRDGADRISLDSQSNIDSDPPSPPDAEDTPDTPKQLLKLLLERQIQQQEVLNDIQSKVGCLFVYMVAGIVLLILAIIFNVFGGRRF